MMTDKLTKAQRCCNAVANYMNNKDDSPKCAQDLRAVSKLLKSQAAEIDALREALKDINNYIPWDGVLNEVDATRFKDIAREAITALGEDDGIPND